MLPFSFSSRYVIPCKLSPFSTSNLGQAVVLFMAEEHVDAVSRMDDLIADSADTFVDPTLYVVQARCLYIP